MSNRLDTSSKFGLNVSNYFSKNTKLLVYTQNPVDALRLLFFSNMYKGDYQIIRNCILPQRPADYEYYLYYIPSCSEPFVLIDRDSNIIYTEK